MITGIDRSIEIKSRVLREIEKDLPRKVLRPNYNGQSCTIPMTYREQIRIDVLNRIMNDLPRNDLMMESKLYSESK